MSSGLSSVESLQMSPWLGSLCHTCFPLSEEIIKMRCYIIIVMDRQFAQRFVFDLVRMCFRNTESLSLSPISLLSSIYTLVLIRTVIFHVSYIGWSLGNLDERHCWCNQGKEDLQVSAWCLYRCQSLVHIVDRRGNRESLYVSWGTRCMVEVIDCSIYLCNLTPFITEVICDRIKYDDFPKINTCKLLYFFLSSLCMCAVI